MPFNTPLFLFFVFPFLFFVSFLILIEGKKTVIIATTNIISGDFYYLSKILNFVIRITGEIILLFYKIIQSLISCVGINVNNITIDGIKIQNFLLFFVNLFFYAFTSIKILFIIALPICFLGYVGGMIIQYSKYKKLSFFFFILTNILILSFFKYFYLTNIITPIGISFMIFKSLSYLCDVYYRKIEADRNLFNYIQYMMFFPQVVSGPIVRYNDFNRQLKNRTIIFDDFVIGLKRFIIGLAKKVLIADILGQVVDKIFGLEINDYNTKTAWLGILCYSLQLYYDFSGYTDMTIGIGKILGFNTPENFNYPYISKTVTEFWRRWHITLGSWFKDYLYIPLGGNRVSKTRMYLNLFVVFIATGIWHGNTYSFLIWGIWHGIFIILEKMLGLDKEQNNKLFNSLKHVYCLGIVLIGWVFFRSSNLQYAIGYTKNMFGLLDIVEQYNFSYYFNRLNTISLIIACICTTPLFSKFIYKENNILINTFLIFILIVGVSFVIGNTYKSFLYFQF